MISFNDNLFKFYNDLIILHYFISLAVKSFLRFSGDDTLNNNSESILEKSK